MKKVILAIDDNEDFLLTLRDMLQGEGYDVVTLSDPSKAEEYIDSHGPDLIMIDVFMPERSGFNIIEDFRERGLYMEIPKIFLTCLDDDVEKMTAKACGVDHYITKPFHPEELLTMVKNTLKGVPRIN
jgi:DNA-binding response OmpR family regulator